MINGYLWTADPLFIIDDPTAEEPTFTAPAHQGGGPDKYTITLTVDYANVPDSVDTVEVTVTKN